MRVRVEIERPGQAGIVAGALYGLEGVVLLLEPRSGTWFYVVYSVFAGATTLTIVAVRGLRAAQGGRDGWLGTAGAWLSSIGLACLAVTSLLRMISGHEILDAVFASGFLLALVGYVVLGIAIFKARVLPRWSAPLPALGVVGAVLLQDRHGAGVAMGVAWILLGSVLLRA